MLSRIREFFENTVNASFLVFAFLFSILVDFIVFFTPFLLCSKILIAVFVFIAGITGGLFLFILSLIGGLANNDT